MMTKTSVITSDLTSMYARGYGAPSRFTNTRVPRLRGRGERGSELLWERSQTTAKTAGRRVEIEESAVGLGMLDTAADAAVIARAQTQESRCAPPSRRAVGRAQSLLAVAAAMATSLVVGAPVASAADACPNAAIRAIQDAGQLADCRAFEQVTPVDKGAGGVDINRIVQAAADGGAIAFKTPNGFTGAPTNLIYSTARSARTATGWTTTSTDLPLFNEKGQVPQGTLLLSPDLSRAVSSSNLGLAPGAVDNQSNLYVHDIDGPQRTLVASSPDVGPFGFLSDIFAMDRYVVMAGSDTLDRVVFQTSDHQVTATPAPDPSGGQNVYEWVNGQRRLVNRLPDGSPSTSATLEGDSQRNPGGLSADGSKIVFEVFSNAGAGIASGGVIYVRVNGTTTLLVSRSHRSGDDPTLPVGGARFLAASKDGRYVFFTSGLSGFQQQLTDTPIGLGSIWPLYRYDTTTDGLVQVATGDAVAAAVDGSMFGVVQGAFKGVSEDGERAYFESQAKLTADGVSGQNQLYVWDHGVTKRLGDGGTLLGTELAISPSGRYAVFVTAGVPVGQPNPSAACGGGQCPEAYTYDAVTGAVHCASCPVEGQSRGGASLGVRPAFVPYYTRSVLDDGTAFFSTPNARQPTDVNNRGDVYASRAGHEELISSGTDGHDASFRDVSANGLDVYFLTAGRLVPQDVDGTTDLYTSRRDGGLTSQNKLPAPAVACTDSCQGPAPAAPAAPELGTISFLGSAGPAVTRTQASVRVSSLRRVAGTAASLKVRVSGPGTIAVSGGSLRSAKKSVGKAAIYTLPVRLTAKARSALGKRKTLKVGIKVTFTPRSGTAVTRTVTATFKAPGARRSVHSSGQGR